MEQLVCVDQDTVHAGHRAFVVVAAASVRTVSLWTLRPVLGVAWLSPGRWPSWPWCGSIRINGRGRRHAGGDVGADRRPALARQQANGHHGWRFSTSRALAPILGLARVLWAGLWSSKRRRRGIFLLLGTGLCVGAIAAAALAGTSWRVTGLLRRVDRSRPPWCASDALTWLLLNVDTVAVSIFGDSTDDGSIRGRSRGAKAWSWQSAQRWG